MKTYRIKPLPWKPHNQGETFIAVVIEHWGYMRVTWIIETGEWVWSEHTRSGNRITGGYGFNTAEAAKAAAQSHWDRQLAEVLEEVE